MDFTPADMARRPRPAAPALRRHVPFTVAKGYPRCGLRHALTWVDTGVFLALGVDTELPDRFVRHFGEVLRTCRTVQGELAGRYARKDAAPGDAVASAAGAVLGALFMPHPRVQVQGRSRIDPTVRDEIVKRLKGLSANPTAQHGGEADLIALAHAHSAGDTTQVLLANDSGASVVADAYGIPTRNCADVLAEMACADSSLEASDLYDVFEKMEGVSRVSSDARPRSDDYMRCRRTGATCTECAAS